VGPKIADAIGLRRADLRMATATELETTLDTHIGGVAPIPIPGATLDPPTIIRGTASLELTAAAFHSLQIHQTGDYRKP
jgi:hypothetical protein